MAAASPASLVFLLLSLLSLSIPCPFLAGAVPPAARRGERDAIAPKPLPPPALAPLPPPALKPLPPPTTAPLPPPAVAPVLPPAMAPAPWELPGYGSKPVPKPVMQACVRTPFPELCARVLSFFVDPKRAADTRRLVEVSTRAAIEAGTALSAFGYVHAAGAKNGTRLRMCVRDCTVRVDAAVKSLNASASALRRGARGEAAQLLGDAAKGCGVCWGSCARFTGEAMHVMLKRARQFEKLVMIASAIILLIL